MDTKELVDLAYELLEALEELVEYGNEEELVDWGLGEDWLPTDRSDEAYAKARLVIAKTRGVTNYETLNNKQHKD